MRSAFPTTTLITIATFSVLSAEPIMAQTVPAHGVEAKTDASGSSKASAGTHDATLDLADTVPPNPLPAPVTTDHVVALPGRSLHFTATAGAIRLADATSGTPLADIGYTYYRLVDTDARKRPLAIALNGGPGASSAWLDIGAIGPWRLPVKSDDISPSAALNVIDNADTWLDFTDLLFIDPLGTGYSRVIGKADVEKTFYSVDGDIGALSTVVRKWLVANDRLASPKFIVGESYGGFRGPKLARKLENTDGIGIAGLIMISPVLDFGWFFADNNPAVYAAHLPSLVAGAKGIGGLNPRAKLQAVESYASGPYLVDLYRGLRDTAAIHRMSSTIATFTGMDAKFVERQGGRVDPAAMAREKNRDAQKIASAYDSTVTGYDPNPFDTFSHHDDPILDALKVPMGAAMADMTANRLKWPVNARYEILNGTVNAHWDWDTGRHPAEAMGDLGTLLALDPHFHALVMHGVSDQVTPYFASKLLIDQMPAFGDASRLRLAVYGGGHMPYLDDGSRAAMREDARKLITSATSEGNAETNAAAEKGVDQREAGPAAPNR